MDDARPPGLRRAAEPDAPDRARGAADGGRASRSPTWCSTCCPGTARTCSTRPYAERRERLDALGLAGPPLGGHAVVPRRRGRRAARPARRTGSRASSPSGWTPPYRPGVRSPDWRKVKNFRTQSVVVGGWRPGQGRRAGGIGSLLFGVPDDEGRLVYAGHVGTGFTDQDLTRPAADAHRAEDVAVRRRPAARGHPRRALGRARPGRARWPTRCGRRTAGCGTRLARACAGRPGARRRGGRSREPGQAAGGDRRADAERLQPGEGALPGGRRSPRRR